MESGMEDSAHSAATATAREERILTTLRTGESGGWRGLLVFLCGHKTIFIPWRAIQWLDRQKPLARFGGVSPVLFRNLRRKVHHVCQFQIQLTAFLERMRSAEE